MREQRNQITTSRQSLGVKGGSNAWCSTCGQVDRATVHVNIDGVYSYLCQDCTLLLCEWLWAAWGLLPPPCCQ